MTSKEMLNQFRMVMIERIKEGVKSIYLNKMVENYQRGIERSTARLNDLRDAFSRRDTLTLDELTAIANS